MSHLSIAASDRYSRQILFAGIGAEGQEELGHAQIAIIGVGATGASTASLLARAGVGKITLIDRDIVEPSNLQRQILFDEADALAGSPKAEAARAKIEAFNSAIEIVAHTADLVPRNIDALLHDTQLILDCTDNFETRYLVNDYAVQQGKPWIYAGAVAAEAATMTIIPASLEGQAESRLVGHSPRSPASTACLACLFPNPPAGQLETCDTNGVLGAAVNLASSLQAIEALKILTGQTRMLRGTFLSIDLWTNRRSEIVATVPDPACAVCQQHNFEHLAGVNRPHVTLCGRNSVQIHEHNRPLALDELRLRLSPQPEITDLRANHMFLRFRRGAHQVTVFNDGRALIQGTTDVTVARSLYARFIGA